MDRRSRCPRSLRGLALESIRAEPETLARLETPLLGHRSAPECRLRPDLLGYLGATLLDGLTGPSAGCRRLLRQFIRGLAVPERSAVCERATWRKDNRFPSGRVGRLGP